jgi:hypothetical protein
LVKYENDIDEVTILSNRVSPRSPLDPNSEITYTNDLAIAADGKVYFSSCSDIVPMRNKEGFYDTFKAWMLGMAQVGALCLGGLIRCLFSGGGGWMLKVLVVGGGTQQGTP